MKFNVLTPGVFGESSAWRGWAMRMIWGLVVVAAVGTAVYREVEQSAALERIEHRLEILSDELAAVRLSVDRRVDCLVRQPPHGAKGEE